MLIALTCNVPTYTLSSCYALVVMPSTFLLDIGVMIALAISEYLCPVMPLLRVD